VLAVTPGVAALAAAPLTQLVSATKGKIGAVFAGI
jgi:hypothetical protein